MASALTAEPSGRSPHSSVDQNSSTRGKQVCIYNSIWLMEVYSFCPSVNVDQSQQLLSSVQWGRHAPLDLGKSYAGRHRSQEGRAPDALVSIQAENLNETKRKVVGTPRVRSAN